MLDTKRSRRTERERAIRNGDRLLYFASFLLHKHPYHHNPKTGSMSVPDAQAATSNFIDLPTVIHIAVAGYLPALSLLRLGGASRWCHDFFPPLATGWLEVTDGVPRSDPDWPPRELTPYDREQYYARNGASLARLLRQMPRLYFITFFITLRARYDSFLREIAEQTVPLLQNFEVSHRKILNFRSRSDFYYIIYKSGRTGLPRPPPPSEHGYSDYEVFIKQWLSSHSQQT